MKSAMDYLKSANEAVQKISATDGIARHQAGGTVFVDVRDSAEIAHSGTIQGAQRIPRGFIEFASDSAMEKFHNPAMQKDAQICLVCGAGGQAALAGQTLQQMGYQNVFNVGGIGDWKDAGGPMEHD